MRRHPVNQPDLLPEVAKVRVSREYTVRDPWKSGGSDGENGDGFSLIDREINAGVVQVVFEDYDGWRVNARI